jgi:hypothetical protein
MSAFGRSPRLGGGLIPTLVAVLVPSFPGSARGRGRM